jgi:hypothetical protein
VLFAAGPSSFKLRRLVPGTPATYAASLTPRAAPAATHRDRCDCTESKRHRAW